MLKHIKLMVNVQQIHYTCHAKFDEIFSLHEIQIEQEMHEMSHEFTFTCTLAITKPS